MHAEAAGRSVHDHLNIQERHDGTLRCIQWQSADGQKRVYQYFTKDAMLDRRTGLLKSGEVVEYWLDAYTEAEQAELRQSVENSGQDFGVFREQIQARTTGRTADIPAVLFRQGKEITP